MSGNVSRGDPIGMVPGASPDEAVYDHRVPTTSPFVSYAQNREDVVLWRALGHLDLGRYVEVGANHPRDDSVTKAFYDRGWSGITIEPMHAFAEAHRAERPRDTLVEAVITDADIDSVVLHEIAGTGLSSIVDDVGDQHRADGADVVDVRVRARRLADVLDEHGGQEQVVHFMLVDTEGAEANVLRSVDLRTFRPWVLLIESTAPNSSVQTHEAWEAGVLEAGYEFCLFDGLSRFYVAREHAGVLADHLAYPACVLDNFVEVRAQEVWADRQRLRGETLRWRAEALRRWADMQATAGSPEVEHLRNEVESLRSELVAMQQTVSWRLTKPIRTVRRATGRP